ncbi:hypothetical protein [Belnapia moabensis]|uniref:hypothetical protein n=1 Tax=Belnapia moabensis TaxID=365533 RepID=UPI0012ED24E2|nr:hypothetical protein [Belnapia moabensis]
MPADDTDPLLHRMREHVRAGGSGRSKLSAWMAEREDEIAEMIGTYGAAWDGWAAGFIAAGLMTAPKGWGAEGPDGIRARRRAAGAARMAWQRLRQRKAAAPRSSAQQDMPQATRRNPSPVGSGNGMQRLLARDEDAAKRRLAALDREMRERSR